MIPTDRYCHSGPGNGDDSILTKLSVMPFCRGVAEYYISKFIHRIVFLNLYLIIIKKQHNLDYNVLF